MLAKQFPSKNSSKRSSFGDENSKGSPNGMRSPTPRQIMSPTVIGSKGMFSANKRKAVDIIREAVRREGAGELEAALRLCEDAAVVFPEAAIVAKVAQLRSKIRQLKQSNGTKARHVEKHHPPVSSGSDIISALLKKNTPKRSADRQPLKEVISPSAVMIRSMAALASKAMAEKAAEKAAEEALPQEHFAFDAECEPPSTEECAAEPVADVVPPETPAEVSREMVANTLKKKVSEAINYQLLDILNNGSADELLGLHLIGQKRVQYIMELREEGFVFRTLDDLSMISFSPKTIRAFKELNIPLAVGVF